MKRHPINVLAVAFLILGGLSHTLFGQEETANPPAASQEKTVSAEGNESRASGSFFEKVARSTRNRMGFSIGVYESYVSNIYPSSLSRESVFVTVLGPRLFANLGRRKSRFHVDYGAAYLTYHQHGNLDNVDQSANATYSYQVSRRITLSISDRFSSATNDTASTFSPAFESFSASYNPSFDVFLNRQRVTQNYLDARLSFQVTRKTRLDPYASYQLYRYSVARPVDTSGIIAGLDYEHQLTKWLYFSGTISTYLDKVSSEYEASNINRLEVGGFRFKLKRHWELIVAGGADYVDSRSENHIGSTIRSGLSRTSSSNVISLYYQRGFTSIIGIAQIFQSDWVTLAMGQQITRRLGLQISGSFINGDNYSGSGGIRGYGARGSLEYALLPNLISSVTYNYQNQKDSESNITGLEDVNRSIVYVGLQYLWPSSRR
jgi:hypothetical protein